MFWVNVTENGGHFILINVFSFMSWKQVIGAQQQNSVNFVTPPNKQNFELNFLWTSPLHMKWIHLIAPIAQVQLAPSLQWCASFFLKLIFTFCKFPSVRRIRLVSEQKVSELPSCGLLLRQRAICNIFCQDVSLFSKSMRVNDCLSKNKPEMRSRHIPMVETLCTSLCWRGCYGHLARRN